MKASMKLRAAALQASSAVDGSKTAVAELEGSMPLDGTEKYIGSQGDRGDSTSVLRLPADAIVGCHSEVSNILRRGLLCVADTPVPDVYPQTFAMEDDEGGEFRSLMSELACSGASSSTCLFAGLPASASAMSGNADELMIRRAEYW